MRLRAYKSLIANEATDPVNVIVVASRHFTLFSTNRQMLAQKSNRHSQKKRNEMMLINNSDRSM